MNVPLDLSAIIGYALAAAAGALGAYVAIRSDLADLKARMKHQEEASKYLHERIDDVVKSLRVSRTI